MIFSEVNFQPVVREDDYKRFLRFPPRRAFEGPLAENAAWARAWYADHGRPWFCAREISLAMTPDTHLLVAGVRVGSPALTARFTGATAGVVVAASAGPEADAEAAARWSAEEPDRYFFIECYAAAVVEALIQEAGRRIIAWAADRSVLRHYCPGYPGWPIKDMPAMLSVVCGDGAALPGPLESLTSGMLRPKKSQIALFGLKDAAGGAVAR